MKKNLSKIVMGGLAALLLWPLLNASALSYGSGTFGSCQYGSCGITLTTNGSINVNITPTASGNCSINSDSVQVMTDDSNGYTLTMSSSTSSSNLVNGGSSIGTAGGSLTSPTTLTTNTWGYRVDGLGGFGSGPTSAVSNASYPITNTFANIEPVSSPDTIASTSTAADPAVTTTVWYGVCANSSIAAGTYASTVVYSAVTN